MMSWYKGSGRPEVYNKHFDEWLPRTQRQAENPWPYKLAIAGRARGLVLDAGCGPGALNSYLEDAVFLDFSRVALTRRWVGRPRPRVLASVEDMPFVDCVFDTIIAIEVIEHTDDPHRFVVEVHRILKEGGQFLLSFPWNDASSTHRFKVISKRMIHMWISPPFADYEYDVPPMRKERGMVYAYKETR